MARQEDETGDVLSTEQVDNIFLEVNKPDKKGRIYGLGSLGLHLASPACSSSSSQQSRRPVYTQDQVSEMVQSQVREQVARLTQEIEQQRDEMERRERERREENERLRLQMEQFMSQFRHHPPPPPSDS